MTSTLGAPAGALASKMGGALALRASSSVIAGRVGSAIGSTVRSTSVVPPGLALGVCPAFGAGPDWPHATAVIAKAAAAI